MTIHAPIIIEQPAMQVISIRRSCKITEIGNVLGELYGKLSEYMGRNQLEFAGPPVCFYHSFSETDTDLEAALQINQAVSGTDEIRYQDIPPQSVVFVDFYGNYDNLMDGWNALFGFLQENELSEAGPTFEIYYTDPEEVQDPEQWRTGIFCPI